MTGEVQTSGAVPTSVLDFCSRPRRIGSLSTSSRMPIKWPLNAAGEIDEPRASQLPVNKTLTVSLRDAWKTFRGSADRECTLVAPEGGLHKGSTLFELRTDEPYVYPEISSGTTSKCEPKA